MSSPQQDPRERLPYAAVVRIAGELSLKSRSTRRAFDEHLTTSVVAAMRRHRLAFHLERTRSRFYVYCSEPRAAEVLARVFGVQGVALTRRLAWTSVEQVVEQAVALHADRLAGKTFAVRVRRLGQREAFTVAAQAGDFERAVGGALAPFAAGVDLDRPEVRVFIELSPEWAWHHLEDERRGPAGLPLDPDERALMLVSGGFDSCVAAWRVMRRGAALDFVFFDLAGAAHVRGVVAVLEPLFRDWIHGDEPLLHVVDLRPLIAQVKTRLKGRMWQVVLKRLMMLAADALARREPRVRALVTGESLGQVSTQTLGNLAPIGHGLEHAVLRPLIGDNKPDIIEEARRIGLHDIAAANPEYCALDAGKVVTRIQPATLDEAVARLDLELLDTLLEARRTVPLTALDTLLEAPSLEIDHVPPQATVLDLRPSDAYEGWHLPEALHLPFEVALAALERLPADRHYVVVCEVGLKSAFVAERLHERGVRAHNFAGGASALRRWSERSA